MAIVRAPNRNFTLGVPASRVHMAGASAVSSFRPAPPKATYGAKPAPNAVFMADTSQKQSVPLSG